MTFKLSPIASAIRASFRHATLPLGVIAASTGWAAMAQAPVEPAPKTQDSAAPAPAASDAAGESVTPSPDAVKLDPIDVEGKKQEGFLTNRTRIGRMEQSPHDIPQSVSVVGEQLMLDRGAYSMREALRNVAGLTFNAGEGGRIGDNITIRGYSVVGDLYLDGIRDSAQYNREMFNLEQIDVMRGSASMLFGRGSTGGVVNQATKLPELDQRRDAAVSIGGFDYRRITADYNEMFSDSAAVRLNAMTTATESFRDGVEGKRAGLAPGIRFGIGEQDEGYVGFYYLKEDNVPDMGVPYDPTPGAPREPIKVPKNRFYGLANADREQNEARIATGTWTHRFSGPTKLRTTVRNADYDRQLYATAPRLPAGSTTYNDSTTINRQKQWRGGEEHAITAQSDLTTTFNTLGLVHETLVGVEAIHEQADRWTNGMATYQNPTTTVGYPNINPALPPDHFEQQAFRRDPNSYEGRTYGVYAQDVVQFAPAWKFLAGARFDDAKADYDRATLGDLSRHDQEPSWRTGVMLQPARATLYYVSYGTSYNPSAELYQLDDRTGNTAPEKSRNIELGAKFLVLDEALALRGALARSEKTNERNTDLAVTDQALLSGRRHTDALELEATGRAGPVEIAAAVAWLDAKIDAAAGTATNTLGKVPMNTPDYTSSIWASWAVSPSWRVGAGLEAVGERYANNTNDRYVPAYERVDLMAAYRYQRYSVQLNVLNAGDRDYYEGVYQGHAVPGVARTALLKFDVSM